MIKSDCKHRNTSLKNLSLLNQIAGIINEPTAVGLHTHYFFLSKEIRRPKVNGTVFVLVSVLEAAHVHQSFQMCVSTIREDIIMCNNCI